MQNCYAILQVPSFATKRQIKTAYRQRVKELHPDLSQPRTDEKSRKLQELFEAYEILLDADLRDQHDFELGFCEKPPYRFDFRSFLRENIEDARCCAKLITFDLYNGRETEALRCFEQYRYVHQFKKTLDRNDYLDFLFLLGEASQKEGKYIQAFLLFGAVLDHEEEKPYFRHFRLEILAHIKYLVCYALPRKVGAAQALAYCIRSLKWRHSGKMEKEIITTAQQLSENLSPEELVSWEGKLRVGIGERIS